MKKICAGLAIAGLLALAGCNTSPTGGGGGVRTTGPHATSSSGKPGTGGATFTLHGPALATTVKHGQTENIKVTIKKDRDFKEGITFSVDPADAKGLKIDVEPKMWKASDPAEVTVKVSADDKTPAGTHTFRLMATPERGDATSLPIEVKVPEKK
jgi:hypothetical protein